MLTVDMAKTGQNILQLRKQAGISVRDIQDTLGLASPAAVYKWQNGMSLPTIDNLVILASMLGVTMDDVVIVRTV